ncbi:NUDIX hydrolase [Candidatus Methylospira mobilis]|uniref:GDP-mannose pyrophosphatase n=1 Tax=Candidatus Methylospira mobilis TaxID=1808979 RepID=A0A5Q0BG01_9GAMM|nr:NUDIX hydrolase [Candidatus Methylospira mobilis]QFY42469.1 NUDIX hydrolase [Candidatus Methylospira mobilis]WNV04425.1 NUDIX hydrolase [Candidatus Methylospira mobilis]
MSQKAAWKQLSRTPIYENPWIRVDEDQVRNPAGGTSLYGCIHFKNKAVGIIPLDGHGNTWLVGQYRYVPGAYFWEIPMGGSPEGEDILAAAKRELQEETGLSAKNWQIFMHLHTSNSVTDEEGFIFIAEDLSEGETSFEETEDITVRKLPVEEAIRMIMDGELTDALSVAALLKLALQIKS